MKIHHIRNACMIIHLNGQRILIDPCLAQKGSLPPYTLFRRKPRFNPLVDLPENAWPAIAQITAGLITHCRYGHFDHLDELGASLLAQKQVPVYCNALDESFLRRDNMNTRPLHLNQKNTFLSGNIFPVPTQHGHGLAGTLMRPGAGYFIDLPGEKTIYISGDTVMTPTVLHVLEHFRPDISILNAGTAILDFGKPILMPIHEQLDFIKAASGKVVAVHLDAFNHCLTSREILKEAAMKEGLSDKLVIPADGEFMEF